MEAIRSIDPFHREQIRCRRCKWWDTTTRVRPLGDSILECNECWEKTSKEKCVCQKCGFQEEPAAEEEKHKEELVEIPVEEWKKLVGASQTIRDFLSKHYFTAAVEVELEDDLIVQLFQICAENNWTPSELVNYAVAKLEEKLKEE